MDIRIKNYLSWSQFNLFKKSPEAYRRAYILGEPTFQNVEMVFGSKIASGLEQEELTGDASIDFCKMSLPEVDEKEKEMLVKFTTAKNEQVPLLIKMDGFSKPHTIYEYKTGHVPWTQQKVDSWGQLTFYAFAYYLATRTMPKLNLIWIPTEKINGEIKLTGQKPVVFKTKRTLSDFAKMSVDIRRVWQEIGEMVKEEALKD